MAAARHRVDGEHHEVEEELHAVLGEQRPRGRPRESDLVVLEHPAGHVLRVAEACLALLRIRSKAKSRIEASFSSSRTSSPFTIAPTGEITSWHTREQRRAARSSESSVIVVAMAAPMNGPIRLNRRVGSSV